MQKITDAPRIERNQKIELLLHQAQINSWDITYILENCHKGQINTFKL